MKINRNVIDTMERRRIVKLTGDSSCKLSLISGKAKPQHTIENPMMKKKNNSLPLVSPMSLFFILKPR